MEILQGRDQSLTIAIKVFWKVESDCSVSYMPNELSRGKVIRHDDYSEPIGLLNEINRGGMGFGLTESQEVRNCGMKRVNDLTFRSQHF